MNTPRPKTAQTRTLTVALALAIGAAAPLAGPTPSLAQTPRPGATPPAAGVPKPTGLDGLSDETVMGTLATFGQETLLNRLFDAQNVPADKRAAIRVLIYLAELGKPISNNRRITLLKTIQVGLPQIYKNEKNATTVMGWAASLISGGIEPDINTLEYWGENPDLQARVLPLAKLTTDLLKHASDAAGAEAKRLEGLLGKGGNEDKIASEWEAMEGMAQQAVYVSNLVAYYIAVGIPSSDQAGRAKVADAAIKYLQTLNNPDSAVQPMVLRTIAKLQMAKGDYATADATFMSLASGKVGDKEIKPAPNDFQVYEGRYFAALCDVLAKKPDQAEKELDELVQWQQTKLPPEVQPQVAAAAEMMRFRLLSTKADLAKDPKQKATADNAAAKVLTELGEKFPQYSLIITEQLVSRVNDQTDLKTQPPLVLKAIFFKGDAERKKPENVPADPKVLKRGLEAAQLLAAGKDGVGGVTTALIKDATLAVPLFYDRMGKGNEAEAAEGYLAYAARYWREERETAGQAVERAFGLAGLLNRATPTDPKVKDLYHRAITTLANDPYKHKEVVYTYADYLRNNGDTDKAIEFYRQVPANTPKEFDARFWELYSLNRLLEEPKTPEARRSQAMGQMTQLIDRVRALAQAQQPQNAATQFRLHYTTILGADLALRQKNADRVLQLLQGFTQAVKGQPNEDALIAKGHFLRTNAYLLKKALNEAAAEVQSLMGTAKDPNAGVSLVQEVLSRLNADFDVAEKAGNEADMASIAASRASLTGHLVNWARNNADAKIKARLPEFESYDANVKLQAAMLQKDAAKRTAAAKEALAAYQTLKQAMPNNTNVQFGLALAQFELGDFAGANMGFGTLIRDGKLGGPQVTETDTATGSYNVKDNAVYWEAMYKWLRSKVARAAADPANGDLQKDLTGAKETLKGLFITHREKIGGEKWNKQFDALRKEIIPEFVPSAAPPPSTQPGTQPATQPVAATTR